MNTELRQGRPRRLVLASMTAAMAIAAAAGAIGLIGGGIDFDRTIDQRLPLDSPVFAGVALVLVVGVPMAAAAVSAWHGSERAPIAGVVAGLAILGWIGIEILLIKTYSWMQPVCAGYGVMVMITGYGPRYRQARS